MREAQIPSYFGIMLILKLKNFCVYESIICFPKFKNSYNLRTSLVVQWLRLHAATAGGMSSIPGLGTKIPRATCHSTKKKKKKAITLQYNHIILSVSLMSITLLIYYSKFVYVYLDLCLYRLSPTYYIVIVLGC